MTQGGIDEVTIVFISVAKSRQMSEADWISLEDKITRLLHRFEARGLNSWNDTSAASKCWQVGIPTSKAQQIRTLLAAVASVFTADIMWAEADVSLIKGDS